MTDDGLIRGLREHDIDSISRAVDVLRDAGFAVDSIDQAEEAEHGVAFGLTVYDPNKSAGLRGDGDD